MAYACDRRRVRLLRPGDARPRARAPRARAVRARLRLATPGSPPPRSTRASRATARDRLPAFVTNDEALASGADVVFLCLDHDRAAEIEPPAARRRRRPLRRPPAAGSAGLCRLVRLRRIPAPVSSPSGATRSPSSRPPTGRLIANPGCYATAALLALAPARRRGRPGDRRRRREVAESRAPDAASKASSHAGAVLENLSAYKVGRHQHEPEIEQAARLPRLLRPASASDPPRADRDLLRTRRRGRRGARACSRPPTRPRPAVSVLPEGVDSRAVARAGHRRRRDRRLRQTGRPTTRSSSARSTTSARAPRARPSRTRTSRSAFPRRPGCGSQECLV